MRVLIVEDDSRLGAQTARFLESRGLEVSVVDRGLTGREVAQREHFDCILLDLNLPDADGVDICRSIRDRSDVPIIIVTGRDADADVVLGLEVGADDYIVKPFSARVLLARIRATVRRVHPAANPAASPAGSPLRAGKLELDPSTMSVTLDGTEVAFTAHEFAILAKLVEKAGAVVSREELSERGTDAAALRTVDLHLSHIRKKLGDTERPPRLIKTIRGRGYALVKTA